MVVFSSIADVPSLSLVVPPPQCSASSDHPSLIAMLLETGQLSSDEAAFLAETRCLPDDIMLLALLHQRRDLTDLEYEFEKCEMLRRVRDLAR